MVSTPSRRAAWRHSLRPSAASRTSFLPLRSLPLSPRYGSRSFALPQPCSGETAMPNTVRLHRVLATKPDKVYRAFIEADAMAKWLPPNGFACTVHHLDAKVGGTFKMSFRNFTTGKSHSFGGQYLE